MTYRIGFIGLGTMGLPMARHLIKQGHTLTIFARRASVFEEQARDLVIDGATPTTSLKTVAEQSEIIITNVLSTDDVHEVLLGHEEAIAHHAAPGTVVIDHSTIDPTATETMAEQLHRLEISLVDAPVSGGVWAAESGTLVSMIGGSKAACDQAQDVMAAYTKQITRVGESGHGQIAKLCNQIAQVITIQGVAESLAFAKELGADPARVLAAIEGGMGGSPMMSLMGPKMVKSDYQAGIAARLHAKDATIALTAAKKHQLPTPCLAVVEAQYQKLMAQGLGESDSSRLYEMLNALRP